MSEYVVIYEQAEDGGWGDEPARPSRCGRNRRGTRRSRGAHPGSCEGLRRGPAGPRRAHSHLGTTTPASSLLEVKATRLNSRPGVLGPGRSTHALILLRARLPKLAQPADSLSAVAIRRHANDPLQPSIPKPETTQDWGGRHLPDSSTGAEVRLPETHNVRGRVV